MGGRATRHDRADGTLAVGITMPPTARRRNVPALFDGLGRLDHRHPVVFLMGLTLLALALRLRGFASRPLWFDEAEQFYISGAAGLRELFARLKVADRNPPGFALLEHAFLAFGRSEALLRLPSLVGGTAAAVMAYAAGRRWLGRPAGIALGLLAAVLPPWVFYAREARPYATGLLLLLALLHAVAVRVRKPRAATSAYVLAMALLAVAWQYASLFVALAALGAGLAWETRARRIGLFSARSWWGSLAIVASFAALLALVVQQPQVRSNGIRSDFLLAHFYAIGSPARAIPFLARAPAEYLEYLAAGTRLGPAGRLACAGGWLPIAVGAAWACRRRRRGRGLALAMVALGPPATLLVLAGLRLHPFGPIRHCLPLAPGLMLLFAAGYQRLRRDHRRTADLALASLLGVALWADLAVIPGWHDHDFAGIVAAVADEARPGDGAIFSVMSGSVYQYYHPSDGPPAPFDTIVYCDAPKRFRAGRSHNGPPPPASFPDQAAEAMAGSSSGRVWLFTTHESPATFEAVLVRRARKVKEIQRLHAAASLWVRDDEDARTRGDEDDGRARR